MFYKCNENQVVRVQREVWIKFSIKDFFSKWWPNPQETADLVTFTEEILNGKLQLSFYHKDYYFRLCTCRTLKSSCTNAVYNEIVGKLFRLCRCRTIKSSCKNVVRIRLCKLSIQWYCQQRFQVVQILRSTC